MPDFSRVIRLAYVRILDREPDPGGLAHYNGLMNGGLTEASMREALLRSPEYAEKNPASAARASVRPATNRKGGRARAAKTRPASRHRARPRR